MFVVATTNLSFYCSHFEWPEIWHADVSWPLQNCFDLGHHLLISLILAPFWLCETGQICNFRTFPGERKGGMTWTLTCWCILTTFWTYKILAMVCLCSSFSHHFDLVKQVKCGVSGDFLQNAWEKWLDIWHADVSWLHCQLFTIWNGLLIFLFWWYFDLVKQVKFAVLGLFLENALEELAELILSYPKKWKRPLSAY